VGYRSFIFGTIYPNKIKVFTRVEERHQIRRLKIIRERRKHQFERALLIGLIAGSLAIVFQLLLASVEKYRSNLILILRSDYPFSGWIVISLLSAGCGAFAVWLTHRYSPESAGSGIPHIKGVLSQVREINWKRIIPIKFIAGLAAIGSGFSLGREGPTVQIGASSGSIIGDLFHANRRERRNLVACGAGAGLAAAFNAPLAGVLFVIEELQKDLSPATYGTALIASVTADFLSRSVMGQFPSFHIRELPIPPLTMLPVYILLGIAAGLMGVVFNRSLLFAQSRLHEKRVTPTPWFGAAIGFTVGIFAWTIPLAIGSGHGTADTIMQEGTIGMFSLSSLVLLLLAKWFITVMCYSTGVPGGIFAPMLVLGCTLGAVIGKLSASLFPALSMYPQAFAVAGMAATFTAIVRTPITGIILILEMTHNYAQLFPLMTACMIAYIIAERLRSQPIYDALLDYDLSRQGVLSQGQSEVFVFETTVESNSPIVGKYVRNAGLPQGCLIISILRNGQEIIPHGESRIVVGDQLTFGISGHEPEAYAEIVKLVKISI
jgi:chloride channel protein, CIC family